MDDLETPIDPLPAGEPEPSTLLVFWADPEAPLAEEVRLALAARYESVEPLEDLDPRDGFLWGTVFRIRDSGGEFEAVIWAEPRGDLSDEFLREQLEDDPAVDLALQSQWLVGVETTLDPPCAQEDFQRQLALAQCVAVPGCVAVYDDNAVAVISGQRLQSIVESEAPPRGSALYAIHPVEEGGSFWLHTHGLARAGVPELDLIGLPEEDVPSGCELLDAVADALLAQIAPDGQGRMEIGRELSIRALDVEQAAQLAGISLPGELAEGEEAHGGRRLVLLDPEAAAPPSAILHALRRRAVFYKSRRETQRQRRLSQSRFGVFGQLFALHRSGTWEFLVKLAYAQRSNADVQEHLWFSVLDLSPGRIFARLLNEPVDVADLKAGESSWHSLDRLTDWVIRTDADSFDPERAPALLRA